MTTTTQPASYRMRIAISSPEIEARIRDVFASRGLDAVLEDAPPAFEVTVVPGGGAPPAPTALGDALHRLVGSPAPASSGAATARYRLALAPAPRVTTSGRTPRSGPGVVGLSPRESQVMACVARGLRNPQIAAELGVSVKTVKNHVNRIFTKLGADGRVAAVLAWQAAGHGARPSRAAARQAAPTA